MGEESGGPRDAYRIPETFSLPHSGMKISVSSRRPSEPAAPVLPDTVLTPALLRHHKGDARAFLLERLSREKERKARTVK